MGSRQLTDRLGQNSLRSHLSRILGEVGPLGPGEGLQTSRRPLPDATTSDLPAARER